MSYTLQTPIPLFCLTHSRFTDALEFLAPSLYRCRCGCEIAQSSMYVGDDGKKASFLSGEDLERIKKVIK